MIIVFIWGETNREETNREETNREETSLLTIRETTTAHFIIQEQRCVC